MGYALGNRGIRSRHGRAVLMIIIATCAGDFLISRYSKQTCEREYEQREIAREWARLAPYPASAEDLTSRQVGGPFTREFEVSFRAPLADIERWLRVSLGTREATAEEPYPWLRVYKIKPGGGAQYAEVRVNMSAGTVH